MSEIHAAIGIEQLKKIPEFLSRRAKNYRALAEALVTIPGISLLGQSGASSADSYYCLSVVLDNELAPKRPEIMTALGAHGIGTSVYYPQPVPRMTYYADKYGWRPGTFPNAERIADQSIALSVGPHLTCDDMAYVADSFATVLRDIRQ